MPPAVLKVFLDDVREAPDKSWVTVRTYDDCISLLETGTVEALSLDHDLGEEKTGYDVLCWIERECVENRFTPPSNIRIHSMNPVGVDNMKRVLGTIRRYAR